MGVVAAVIMAVLVGCLAVATAVAVLGVAVSRRPRGRHPDAVYAEYVPLFEQRRAELAREGEQAPRRVAAAGA